MTRLLGFSAEAEVLGLLREVEYEGGCLTIGGLTLEQAYEVISALASGTLSGLKTQGGAADEILNGVGARTVAADREECADKVDEDEELSLREGSNGVAEVVPLVSQIPSVEMAPAEPETVKAMVAAAARALPAVEDLDPPDKVVSAKHINLVYKWLVSLGYETYPELLRAVTALRGKVPTVDRVKDLADRTKRCCENSNLPMK
jgi:hypothetical protein